MASAVKALVVKALIRELGEEAIVARDTLSERATSYWNASPTRALAKVCPRTTEEVSRVMRMCHRRGQPVVVQGGLTGCVQGAESSEDELILSLEKMCAIEEIDDIGGTATVQAGAVLQVVREAVAEKGLRFPLDLGARASCTIGGNVATNAGGINVLRYGMMRNLVLGLEAVLADGTVVSSMNHMLKNNAGYDLKQLFVGTEGTLGVVTRVVLKLFPQPTSCNTALVALNGFDEVVALLKSLERDLAATLSAFEVMWGNYFQAVTGEGKHRAPMGRHYPFYVVLEAEGADPRADLERFEQVLERAMEEGVILDAVLPKSEAERRAVWDIREVFDAVLENPPTYLYDVSLPIKQMASYVENIQAVLKQRWPESCCYVFGHIADGNLHLFVKPGQQGEFHNDSDLIVYTPLKQIGGSVSAEHGIGKEKRAWLDYSRNKEELALMKILKRTLDPKNILNPGRVLEN